MQIRFVFLTVALTSTFWVFGKGLPEGYQALEYVESEGPRASTTAKVGQFIDTGVVPNGRVPTVRIKYRLSDSSLSGEGYVFGYWNLANNVGTAIGILNGSGRYRVCDKAIYYGSPDKNVHEFELNTNEGTIMDGIFAGDDGSKLRSVIDNEKTYSYYLFARYHSAVGIQKMPCQIFRARIWMDGEKVRDYVPCLRLSDNKAGMYEMVEGNFCLGEGDTPFVAGPETTFVDDGEEEFKIGPVSSAFWIGEEDGPRPEVRDADGNLLTEGTDYVLSWAQSSDMLHATVIVSGIGAHEGTAGQVAYALKFTAADIGGRFKKLKYLESQDGSCLYTGVIPNGKVPTVKLTFQMLRPTVDDKYAFGYWSGSTGTAIGIYDSKFRYRVMGTTGFAGPADDKVHTMLLNSTDGTYFDGEQIDDKLKSVPDTCTSPYALFARVTSEAPQTSACRIYAATFWLDGEMVRDYVPCMVAATGKCGLFDKVACTFCTDDTKPLCHYIPIKYAESTGKPGCQVSTQLNPGKTRPEVELTYRFTSIYNENWAFGYWSGSTGTAIGMTAKDGSVQTRYRVGDAGGFYGSPDLEKHTILFNSTEGTFVDGKRIGEPQGAIDAGLATYDLFGRTGGLSSVQIFSCKIWLNGELKGDYRPMRRSYDGCVGLYDEVDKKFLMPAGPAGLIAGPDISNRGLVIFFQ